MARFVLRWNAITEKLWSEVMAAEVDRLLNWMDRVERLEIELEKADLCEQRLACLRLESARNSEQAAFAALVAAANRGDPEALVALEALESEIEKKTWSPPRSAA